MAMAMASCYSVASPSLPEAFMNKTIHPFRMRYVSGRLQFLHHLRQGTMLIDGGTKKQRGRNTSVLAEYNGRRSGGGDFYAGFLLGGVVFGALGYLLAPQITRVLSAPEGGKGDDSSKKLLKGLDDEGIVKTRRSLNEKIAQLNAAIDDVSAQVRSDDGFGIRNESTPELETAV